MKLSEIPNDLKPHVEIACLLCLEKRNLKLFQHQKASPCALRCIRGEICDELEKVLQIAKQGENGLILDDVRLKTK